MKRVLIGLCALAVVLPSLAPASGSRARLTIADRSPLVVRGAGFKAHDHVVVTVVSGRRLSRSLTAGAAGTFVARWDVTAGTKAGCAALVVTAAGARGSAATMKMPAIECPQGPADPGP